MNLPEDKMPVVTVKEGFTPATFNTMPLTGRLTDLFKARFGDPRVAMVPASMAGEDFSYFNLPDKSVQTTLFWVGGVPQATWDKAKQDGSALPSLHSAFWAPDAEKVVATATEAMTAAALDLLRRK
jgi:hippurate hydrolase